MSGIVLGTGENCQPHTDKIVIGSDVGVYHGKPVNFQRFVRVVINGVVGRLFFEEVTEDEDTAQITRHYQFEAQRQAADEAIAKASAAKEKAKQAQQAAQEMTKHNLAILAQLNVEIDRRKAMQTQLEQVQAQLADLKAHCDAALAAKDSELAATAANLADLKAHCDAALAAKDSELAAAAAKIAERDAAIAAAAVTPPVEEVKQAEAPVEEVKQAEAQ